MKIKGFALLLSGCLATISAAAEVDWEAYDAELLAHFQALVRMDTTDPPGREIEAANYLVEALAEHGHNHESYETCV